MNHVLTPLDYGRMACDTMMRRYDVNELPPKGYGRATFNYHQGVFLTGMSRVYNVCKDERYLDYIKRWAKAVQNEDGTIYEPGADWISLRTLDYRQPANVLFFLYEQTGDPHYVELIRYLAEDLYENYPRNEFGGFWHFFTTPGQMWLDGLYMAGVLLAHYGSLTGRKEYIDLGVQQIFIMYEHMRDPKSGLLYHGWDPTGKAVWADPKTGCSPEIWARACGWFVLAIADMLDFIPEDDARRERVIAIQRELIEAVVRNQSDEGRWYEVVDKWREPGNWPENSGTCLFIYSICKGVRQGYIDQKYFAAAKRAYDRVIETLLPAPEGEFSMGDVCVGTCIEEGTYAYYIGRERIENDLHGMGAFLLMIGEMAQLA
jgi:unsaturated rhamnogalacturonyl hydrolase